MPKQIKPVNGYSKPWRIPQAEAAHMLGYSVSGLQKLVHKDPTFPRPMKDGQHKACKTFFVTQELESWLEEKARQRDQQAA